ncbi:MAG: hypothetical protein J7604_26435 [Sporocytophaga sp.]|uniref:hypothetical protein n=1 Tax=Sporocytophaga sp. TaxID=2231183 RepID=UPI001B0E316C|nr:hypothetical protein [Sporocytophaga sp.]MBO9703772.1 hypothetical protein [Sporocytophaga sp.]
MINKIRLSLLTLSFCVATILCSYAKTPGNTDENTSIESIFKSGIKSDKDTRLVIKAILGVIGLKANFEIKPANVPNATAIIQKDKRYILYNPSFISSINNSVHTNWAAISILAHEIGHHLNGHTLIKGGSNHRVELECDEFSGFILRKMGASLKEAQAAVNGLCRDKEFPTHPGRKSRLNAIERGWNKADWQQKGLNAIIKETTADDDTL